MAQPPTDFVSNIKEVPAVFGNNTAGGIGVSGYSKDWWGTSGESKTSTGVVGVSDIGWGTSGYSNTNTGVVGISRDGWGVYGKGARFAGFFEGRVNVTDRLTAAMIQSKAGLEAVTNIVAGGDIIAGGYIRGKIAPGSDKNIKENFSYVNTFEILNKLENIPIQSWNYKDDSSSVRHIGPTAQDFHATFGLNGEDETQISSVDLHGVALAAIQGLNVKLKAENDELHAKLASLEERLSALESKG